MAKIYISPSTQSHNAYAAGLGSERDNMRKLRDIVERHLKAAGHSTKTHNYTNTINAQVNDANAWGADWFVSLHSNAMAGTTHARGSEVWIYKFGGKAEVLAKAVYKRLAAVTPTKDRGVKASTYYGELRMSNMPAILVEVDFHHIAEGAKWIVENMDRIGLAIAQGVCDVAGGTLKAAPTASPTTTQASIQEEEEDMKLTDVIGQDKDGKNITVAMALKRGMWAYDAHLDGGFTSNRLKKIEGKRVKGYGGEVIDVATAAQRGAHAYGAIFEEGWAGAADKKTRDRVAALEKAAEDLEEAPEAEPVEG